MGKSQETFSKKEKEKKRLKKRQDKQNRKEARKENNNKGASLDDMIAYVDEFGNIVDTPPDPTKRKKVKLEDIQISVPTKEDIEAPAFLIGFVDFFNHEKGFGFIKDRQGEKYFVHITNAYPDIQEGDEVEFDTAMTPKGINAVDVLPAGSADPGPEPQPEPTGEGEEKPANEE